MIIRRSHQIKCYCYHRRRRRRRNHQRHYRRNNNNHHHHHPLFLLHSIFAGLLYPARSRWGTYHGCCSKRDGARTSVKTGSWAGRTHLQ